MDNCFKRFLSLVMAVLMVVSYVPAEAFATEIVEVDSTVHEHTYEESIIAEATCTEAGTVSYTCSCEDSYTEEIPANGHDFVDGACTVCGEADPNYIPPTEETEAPKVEETEAPEVEETEAPEVEETEAATEATEAPAVEETEAAEVPEVETDVELNFNGTEHDEAAVENPVAQIGDVPYATLQEALDAAVAGTGNVTVEILADINLTGVAWTPVTVSGPGYPVVTVNGNDKTITGLTDMLFAGTWAGGSGLIINDLTIKDSAIVNDKDDAKGTVGVGAFIGFPQASAIITLNNCRLVNSSVEGGHWTGGLIGYAAGYAGTDGPVFMNLTITNCSVTGSTITGKGSAGGVIGHGSGNAWTNVVIENTNVSGNTVTSTGSSANKAGAIMGTIGAAGQPTTVNGVEKTGGVSVAATVSDNIVTSNGTTITTIYGRQGTPTGTLEIAGGSYEHNPIEKGVTYAYPAKGYEIAEGTDGSYGLIKARVAEVNSVKYGSLAEAVAKAKAGDEIVLLADVTEDVTLPAGVIFNGNGKQVGTITAAGEVTFKGHTKATNFSVQNTNTTINIGEGACLEITGTGRLVIGHGCTFNITGTITDAKTANTADLTPSLIMPGASFTGAGVNFIVKNAYIKAPSSYCSSSKTASDTFDFYIENSIWENGGKLAFEAQSVNATVNFNLKDSVLTTGSYLVFGVSRGEVIIDNSNVNVDTSRQIENQSTMTIKNGSVVNGAVATSSNAKNPGTIIVEDATYEVTGEFSGSDLGTGTLIVKKGATVSAGSITKANIQIDATGMNAGDEINLTADLSKLTGNMEVINNDDLVAKIEDGKVVLAERTLSGTGTQEDPFLIEDLVDLKLFAKKVNAGDTFSGKYVKLNADIDLKSEEWTPISKFQGHFDGGDHTISNLIVNGGSSSNQGFFGHTDSGSVSNLTINNAKVTGRLNVGVVAGTPYTSKYTNIKVTGHVEVNGMAYVGGVGGKNAYANWTDITVYVDDSSYVKATSTEDGVAYRSYVGGVVGFNGEGGHTFKNISSNIKVIGDVCDIGGLFGIAHYNNNFENVTFTGSVEAPEGAEEVGGIAGVWHNEAGTKVTMTGVESTGSVTVGSVTTTGSVVGGAYNASNDTAANSGSLVIDGASVWPVVAKIGDQEFGTLKAAAEAAQDGDEIILLDNATVDGTLALPAGITLTSNGHTITGSIRMLGSLHLNGPLTITGRLWVGKSGETMTATLSGDKLTAAYFMFQHGTYTIDADIDAVYGYLSYNGTFEVNSTIHTTGTNGEVLYINGDVTLNDGAVLDSDNSVFVCNEAAVLTLKPGSKVDSNIKLTVSGAKLNSSGDITGKITVEKEGASVSVTGGTYSMDVSAWCPEGYVCVDKENGTYGVKAAQEAWILRNNVPKFYATLAAAIADAQPGETVMLCANAVVDERITINKDLTISDYGSLTVTFTGDSGITIVNDAEVTLDNFNINISNVNAGGDAIFCIGDYSNNAKLNLDNMNVTGDGYSVAYAVFYVYNTSELNINGGKYDLSNDKSDEGGFIKAEQGKDGIVNITDSNISLTDAKIGFLDGTVKLDGVELNIKGGANAINQSALTVIDSTITVDGANGRALTLSQGDVTIQNSTLNFSNCSEGEIRFKKGLTLNVDEKSTIADCTVYADASAVDVANINGEVINGTEANKASIVDGKVVNPEWVAKIGGKYYATLTAALADVKEGDTINLMGTIAEDNVKLPAVLKNVTFQGTDGTILKDMTIMASDGNSIDYQGITFDGIIFDNSNISITGWRNGTEIIKDITINDCEFRNLERTGNMAAVHLNLNKLEPLVNFTFTNNVIDGVSGSSNSGIYCTGMSGNIVISDNTINNVAFRPFILHTSNDDGVADSLTVTNNIFSGSAEGRLQILGTNTAGADSVTINATENTIKDIVATQYIWFYNFNADKTHADLSKNYYDIDIVANPSRIYFNSAAADVADLIEKSVYPYYADEAKTELVEAPVASIGSAVYGSIDAALEEAKSDDTIVLHSDAAMQTAYDVKDMTLTITGAGKLTVNDKLIVHGESTLNISAPVSGEVLLGDGAILKDSTINGDVFVAGKVIFRGDNTVNMLYDFGTLVSNYGAEANMEWTVDEGGSLTLTSKSRYGLGYGDKITVKGELTDALSARETLTEDDLSLFMHGISMSSYNGYDKATLDVENAYVTIGSNSSFGTKTGNSGEFAVTFKNSVLNASRITIYDTGAKSTFDFTGTDAKIGTFMTRDADSTFTFVNSMLLSTATSNGTDEGNYHAGKMVLDNSELTYSAQWKLENGTVEMDINSSITAPSITGTGKIVIDATGYSGASKAVISGDMSGFTGTVEVKGAVYEITDSGLVITAAAASINDIYYATLAEAFEKAEDGDEVQVLIAGTYALSTSGKDITITGAVDGVEFNCGQNNIGMDGASVTFNNVTFNWAANGWPYHGLAHCGDMVYNDCTFNGTVFLYGTSETFNKCEFNVTGDTYNVWTYGAKEVAFNECTFNSAGKSVLIYNEGAAMFNDVTVTDCDFIASAPVDGKAAIEMDSSLTAGINLTIDADTTATGFGSGNVSGNSLWNNKKGNNTDANNDITVVVNNETVLAPVTFVAKIGEIGYTDLHEAMVATKAGETLVMVDGVDLAGTEWEPVSFKGTFDGQNHKISNLTINKPGVSNTGFITSLNGTFKNVTFTNPTVTGGDCTGVVAGRAGGSAALAENITVNGTIKVETTHSGYARTGVIVGGWAYGNYKNITVDGGDKAVSYIKHTGGGDGRYVAGIVGHADDVESYVNCTVKNITISGGWLCGGIAGPGPSDGLATGCVVENIDMNADYSGGMFGWYYGSGTIEDSSVKNVSFTAGTTNNGAIGGYSTNPSANVNNVTIENVTNGGKALLEHVAEVDGVYYFDLKTAVEAANGKTVTMLQNTKLTEGIVIPADATITLDLNGKTVSYSSDVLGTRMLVNNGDLTITDAVGEGKITYSYVGAADPGYTKTNATIENYGTLTVVSGIVENTTASMALASYAINTNAAATLNVEGGQILNLNGHAIRQVSFGTAANTVTVSGGYIEGTRALQFQLPGSAGAAAPEMTLNISGGELKSNEETYNLAVYVFSNGQSASKVKVNISDKAILNGNVAVNAAATASMEEGAVTVTGGTFNGAYGVFSYADEDTNNALVITGGAYNTVYVDQYLEEGFGLSYVGSAFCVVPDSVAFVNGEIYGTIQAAVEAAEAGDTILLLKSFDENDPLKKSVIIDKDITLDLNSMSIAADTNSTFIRVQNGANVTVKNGNITSASHYVFTLGASDGSSEGNLTIESGAYVGKTTVASVTKGTLTITGGDFTEDGGNYGTTYLLNCIDANYNDGSAKIVVSGGTFHGFDPANNAAENPAANFCAEGYTTVADGDAFKVVEKFDAIARNEATDEVYDTISDAVAAAESGATIVLLQDAKEDLVMLKNNVILDLNGYNLESNLFIALKGTQVLNTKTTGILKVPQDGISLQKTNSYVPVWNEQDGYYLVDMGYYTGYKSEEGKYTYYFLPKPRNGSGAAAVINTEVVNLLKNGAADNQLSIEVRITWTTDNGIMTQTLPYKPEHIVDVYTKNGELDNAKEMFNIVVTGYEKFSNVTINAAVVSDLGSTDVSSQRVVK